VITKEQQDAIADYLAEHYIPAGFGIDPIVAINLALTGECTNKIPACMSEVVGRWIVVVQDAMPDDIRNGERWKALLPLAAGTGREHERERMDIILDWMWSVVLPDRQAVADARGFGDEWRTMCTERTEAAAKVVTGAVWVTNAGRAAADTADAAWAAARDAAKNAKRGTAEAVAWAAANAIAWAAAGAAGAAADAARAAAWERYDPCGLLERLIKVRRT